MRQNDIPLYGEAKLCAGKEGVSVLLQIYEIYVVILGQRASSNLSNYGTLFLDHFLPNWRKQRAALKAWEPKEATLLRGKKTKIKFSIH